MVVVRNIFRIKFGKSKEATALWKQGMALAQKLELGRRECRLLTDLAGPPFYTLVFETTHDSLADWEKASKTLRADPQWLAIYQQITPLVEEGRREILATID